MTAGTKEQARETLERNRVELAALARDVGDATARLPMRPTHGWSGTAAWAFHCAVMQLHGELLRALSELSVAQQLTYVALREVSG